MNADIEQHFRSVEMPFVQQAGDWIAQAKQEYRLILTPFLNPRERYILQTLINREDELQLASNGVFSEAEMQRSAIIPEYLNKTALMMRDFDICLLQLDYPHKFVEMHHRTILGALMHNGIERNHVGDIVTDGQGRWQLVTTKVVAEFLNTTIERMGKVPVHFVTIAENEALQPDIKWEMTDILASSTRFDTIIANAYTISRGIAKSLIENGQVKLNWTTQIHPDIDVAIGDLISVRGYGRLQVVIDNGLTRKAKHKLSIAKLKK